MPTPTLTEIAARLQAHLTRLEQEGDMRFRQPRAWRYGRYVRIRYRRGVSPLTKDVALAYLAWLDAGGSGPHCEMEGKGDGSTL